MTAYRDEPIAVPPQVGLTTTSLTEALRWYQDNMSPEKLAPNVSADCANRFFTYFKCARLIERGFTLPHSALESFNRLKADVDAFQANEKADKEETKLSKPKVDIQAATRAKAMPVLDKITVQFDKNLLASKQKKTDESHVRELIQFNWYEFLRTLDIPGMYVPQIIQQIKDDDKKHSAYPEQWDAVIADLEKIQKSASTRRAPRKKKAINVEKVVGKLTYLKEDAKLKITSLNPEKVLGAQELWTYMTDRKYVTHYVADGPNGLSIKGTTIHGFNPEQSARRKLRKPEEFLKVLADSRSSKARKALDKLTTKSKDVSGRVSDMTLLVKVA